MKIVQASSEAVPFSKTGGLADVTSALSDALNRAGHEVWLIVPHYSQFAAKPASREHSLQPIGLEIEVQVGTKRVHGKVLQAKLPNSNVTRLFVDQPEYFDRDGLYQHEGNDYKDNCERFVFFSRAVMEIVRRLEIQPDILHAHDWQTALTTALLDIEDRQTEQFSRTASVLTIHNLAFQGQFWHWDMLLTGLDWKYFNLRQMEFFNHLNLMKTGISFADMVTTVSPTYATEIQTAEFGCGLDGMLSSRKDDLVGILNGVDTTVWNPEIDPHLIQDYSHENVIDGKAACKAHLQEAMGLPVKSDVPLIGMISRMADQKGLDIIAECIDEILAHELQMCFLGTGDPRYEDMLRALAEKHPEQVAVSVAFDEKLAHEIEAGADMFLMPSRFEPCGLNQMYSLLYGTVPIVRAVGGLADSVVDADEQSLADGTANGFSFREYSPQALAETIARAVDMFGDRRRWKKLIDAGMQRDWSWKRSAREYLDVYDRALSKRKTAMVG